MLQPTWTSVHRRQKAEAIDDATTTAAPPEDLLKVAHYVTRAVHKTGGFKPRFSPPIYEELPTSHSHNDRTSSPRRSASLEWPFMLKC